MKRKIAFNSDTSHLAMMRDQARKFLSANHFEECETEMLVLALDEACTNIIRYAYDHASRPIRIDMERLEDRVRFSLRDYGRNCDPSLIKSRPLEDIRPGGVGVHIIRHVFDHVEYQPRTKGTKLILEKKLHTSPHSNTDAGKSNGSTHTA